MKNKRFDVFMDMTKGIVSDEMVKWVKDNGFFTAPASTKYHGNYEGGLFDHSLEVTRMLLTLTEDLGLEWKRHQSPIIAGMFHDLCKIDEYEFTPFAIEKKGNQILTGHGDKSVMLLSQFMQLTEEEVFCIRFHMGAYQTDDWNSYGKAIEKYQTVLWTHTADMFASRVKKT